MFDISIWDESKCIVWLFNHNYLYNKYHIIDKYYCYKQSGNIDNGFYIDKIENGIQIIYRL